MLGTYTYHEIIRKTVVGFGTLFNNIELSSHKGIEDRSYEGASGIRS